MLLYPNRKRLFRQESLDGNILVDFSPVNADASANESPVATLLSRRSPQSWKPFEGNGYLSAIG